MKRTRKIPVPASSAEEREIAVADIDCVDDGAQYGERPVSDGGAAGAPSEALKKRAASVIIPARASEPPMNTADERRLLVIEAP